MIVFVGGFVCLWICLFVNLFVRNKFLVQQFTAICKGRYWDHSLYRLCTLSQSLYSTCVHTTPPENIGTSVDIAGDTQCLQTNKQGGDAQSPQTNEHNSKSSRTLYATTVQSVSINCTCVHSAAPEAVYWHECRHCSCQNSNKSNIQ